MVERRNAEEAVLLRLPVVVLFDLARMHEAVVLQDDGLREARGAGTEVDGGLVVVVQRNGRRTRRAVPDHAAEALREGRAVVPDIEAQAHARHAVRNRLDAARELGPEHERVGVGEFEAVLDFVRRIAEIQGNRETARLQDAEVDRQPLQAVHQQNSDLVALLETAAEQEVGEPVRLHVELAPRDFTAEGIQRARFDEGVLAPGRLAVLKLLRIDFDQGDVVRPLLGVPFKDFRDLHESSCSLKFRPTP